MPRADGALRGVALLAVAGREEKLPAEVSEYMAFTQGIVDLASSSPPTLLQGTETATSVRKRDGRVGTTDGPFVETKEVLGGYYIVDVKDLDRAIEVTAQIPDARTGGIEIRSVMVIPG